MCQSVKVQVILKV